MIARVRGVMRAATSSGSRLYVHRIDVREDGRCAAPRDRLRRRVEGERRADHLVARPDPERVEHEHERIRAVRDADRVLRRRGTPAASRSNALHVRPEDERARLEHLGERALQLRNQRRVLRLDVNERDLRHGVQV
jgi:hypothetical protein